MLLYNGLSARRICRICIIVTKHLSCQTSANFSLEIFVPFSGLHLFQPHFYLNNMSINLFSISSAGFAAWLDSCHVPFSSAGSKVRETKASVSCRCHNYAPATVSEEYFDVSSFQSAAKIVWEANTHIDIIPSILCISDGFH